MIKINTYPPLKIKKAIDCKDGGFSRERVLRRFFGGYMTTKKLREQLLSLCDAEYKKFNDALLPGVHNTLGVRVPQLRKLAQQIAKEDWRDYLRNGEESYYEDLMIKGMVIGYAKMQLSERLHWLDFFVPKIDSWGICDSCCMTYKFIKNNQEETFQWLKKYIGSSWEFEVRFALVILLDYFVNDAYVDKVLEICDMMCHEGYYAKMAAAWAVSVCFAKYPEKTFAFLKRDKMDLFTHNKAIQKCCESFRVTKEMKIEIRKLKR